MIEEALLSAGLLIVVAKLLEGVFRRFRLNAIVAYTVAGIILGPVTGIVDPTGETHALLGIGIFLFFFLIGLDHLDIAGFLAAIRGRFFVAAIVSVLISLKAALLVTYDYEHDFGLQLEFTGSLALAGILSLTSLGVVAKVLADEGRLRDRLGIQLFTTALIAELFVLLVVGFSIGEHTHHLEPASVLILLAKVAAFVALTWLLATRLFPPVILELRRMMRVPQLSFGLVLGTLFLAVVAAEEMGLHGSLGALLFGVAMSRLPYQLRREIVPGMRSVADGLFVPLFFSSAGLHLTLAFAEVPLWTIIGLVVIPFFGKFAGVLIGAYVARLESPFAIATGLMAKGVAEVALLLVLLETGIIGPDIFSLLVLVMLAYILFAPPLISLAIQRAGKSAGPEPGEALPLSLARFVLEDFVVGDVINPSTSHPTPEVTLRDFADQWVNPLQQDYVVAENGSLVGTVSLPMLRYVPRESWPKTRLEKIARAATVHAWSDEPVEDALQRMTEHGLTALPVLDRNSEKFLGAITSQEIMELLTSEAVSE